MYSNGKDPVAGIGRSENPYTTEITDGTSNPLGIIVLTYILLSKYRYFINPNCQKHMDIHTENAVS